MRPTFMGFETARKGMMANQKGLDITGNNITNINTSGYTRQRIDYVSVSSASSGRYGGGVAVAGQGVAMNGVSQIRDSFLDKRFREEYADVGFYDQNTQILSDLESALDEVTSSGMKEAIKNMITALNDFTKNPDQGTNANIVLTAAKNMAQVLNQFDAKLNNVLEQQIFNVEIAVSNVNSLLEKIASLNHTISGDMSVTGSAYGPNELMDQRNLLLDELSQYGEIRTTAEKDGTVTVQMNGHTVVKGDDYDTLNLVKNIDSTISFGWQSNGKRLEGNKGSLKAFEDMINGHGPGASGINESFEKGIPYYKEQIDKLAQQLVSAFNSTIDTKASPAIYELAAPTTPLANGLHNISLNIDGALHIISVDVPAAGTTVAAQSKHIAEQLTGAQSRYKVEADAAGNLIVTSQTAGKDPHTFGGFVGYNPGVAHTVKSPGLDAGQVQKDLFEPLDKNQVTAANITVSDAWAKDASYIITDINGDGEGDNTYILALLNVFNTKQNFGNFTGTFEEYVNQYNTTLGQQKEFNLTRLDASASIADEMLNRRDSISGVSLDEEGTNLMVFDKAYKASSRLMTALDEALDTLINKTGLVGR